MRTYLLILVGLLFCGHIRAQNDSSIQARIILIGDAGEMDKAQETIMPAAAAQVIKGRTTVLFLGDNIYPHGMGLPDSKEEAGTQDILRSQFRPMRAAGAPVYFIPGNHDWDRMGPLGLAKIKRQWEFLDAQNDSLLQLVPPNGCPDPVVINISDSVVIIAMDSEWWLFPYDKDNPGADCNCSTKRDVINALQELLYQNRNKTILLATHHPFQSYGTHGGYFSWKDHLFPLTLANKDLYIPLPVVGSLYPFLRRTFTNPEDLHHPLYHEMIRTVDAVFEGFPNLIHISGHEHGLQLIDNPSTQQVQVVSGGGAKENYTIKGKNSLFGKAGQGYVVADILQNHHIIFTFYTYDGQAMREAFRYGWDRYKPYAPQVDSSIAAESDVKSEAKAPHPAYNEVSGLHRLFFGKNYRAEWARPVTLPLLHLSQLKGGLMPEKLGGGFQSTSLRLQDGKKNDFTLRLVEKSSDLIVPEPFKGTFVRDILDDATSAQHPYSALIVAPISDAVGVPHATPVIGIVAPDRNLGMYSHLFTGKIALLEEREPLGNTDNYDKMLHQLQKDNDNTYDAPNFLKARMLDFLFADWDRHGDQWRFYNRNGKGEDKDYIAIPRDRDMVLNMTQGIIPFIAKHYFLMPRVYGFFGKPLIGSDYYFYKSAFLNAHPASQIGYRQWMTLAEEVTNALTDSVLSNALSQMPSGIDSMRHDGLLHALQARRDAIPAALDKYYRFCNRIVDIHTSDKNEFIYLKDIPDSNAVQLTVRKINKHGKLADTLVSKIYPYSITKEIRLFTGKGDDSVVVSNQKSSVKLRIIGGKGDKAYNILHSPYHIPLYDREQEHYYGQTDRLRLHLSKDSAHTAFEPTNLYNTSIPLLIPSYNPDDGISIGVGARFTLQRGFRKKPYTSLQEIIASHSFSTKAFNIKYRGEWIEAIGKADITMAVDIKAPENTQNFFGRGNETAFDKKGDFKRYYRTRFMLIQAQPSLRWRSDKKSYFSIGPSLQYYHYNPAENTGRFINNVAELGGYDSAIIDKDKAHAGLALQYLFNGRNNDILPTWGSYVNIRMAGYDGLNKYSRAYMQVIPEIALYKSLNMRQTIILADRIGGGVTMGKTAFYQSLFLGGQDNLSGFRQYRFAGRHSFYNNLELRLSLAKFGSYLLNGQLGLTGFYDIGRVWESNDNSGRWHNGVGAGIYFAPANLAVIRFDMGYSPEGWFPTVKMGVRF